MFKFKRIQFSEYRENKFLYSSGYDDFKKDLSSKGKEGTLKVYLSNNAKVFNWSFKKYFSKLIFKPHDKEFKNKFVDFKNSLLSLIRIYGVLYINVSLSTGQFHKNKEIKEIWGYRMFLLEDCVFCEKILSEKVYENCTLLGLKTPDYHTVYCGQDDKIFGWDRI